jgi:hypothetical protein
MRLRSHGRRLPLGNNEIHVLVDRETNEHLVERLSQATRLKVEAEQSLERPISNTFLRVAQPLSYGLEGDYSRLY